MRASARRSAGWAARATPRAGRSAPSAEPRRAPAAPARRAAGTRSTTSTSCRLASSPAVVSVVRIVPPTPKAFMMRKRIVSGAPGSRRRHITLASTCLDSPRNRPPTYRRCRAGHRSAAAVRRAWPDLRHQRDGLGLDAASAHPRQPRQHRDPAGDGIHARVQRPPVRAAQVVGAQLGAAHGLEPRGARRRARRVLRPDLPALRAEPRQAALGRQDAAAHLACRRHGAAVPGRRVHRDRPPSGRQRRART